MLLYNVSVLQLCLRSIWHISVEESTFSVAAHPQLTSLIIDDLLYKYFTTILSKVAEQLFCRIFLEVEIKRCVWRQKANVCFFVSLLIELKIRG